MLARPVVEAMAEASQKTVRLVELQNAVGGAIATLSEGQEVLVAKKLREVLLNAAK